MNDGTDINDDGYCLYPLYVEGDEDIAEELLTSWKVLTSVDLVKINKVTDYISFKIGTFEKIY